MKAVYEQFPLRVPLVHILTTALGKATSPRHLVKSPGYTELGLDVIKENRHGLLFPDVRTVNPGRRKRKGTSDRF